jgi:hypothetical protein
MAGKYALYLPYKVIDSLSKGNVTDSQFREFIMGLVEYDRSGMFPASPTEGFTMMFELLKSDLDYAKTKYEDIIEKRRAAGRMGGAPKENKNAAKAAFTDQAPEPSPKKQAKQAKQPDDSDICYLNSNNCYLNSEKENNTLSVFPENPQGENPPPDDRPVEKKEDAAALFQKARLFWNEKGLRPECRDIIMRCSDQPEILRSFQHYSWDEIRNAIGNYYWHKTKAGPGYSEPPPYLSLAGFLKTGVEKYFDDDALDQQFGRGTK